MILLTGKPGIGKSTAIEKFISLNTLPSSWVVTKAILQPETGLRLGFQAKNSDGKERIISHKIAIQSDVVIGENHVAIEAVDDMFADILYQAIKSEKKLIIIDEIGPIQLLSESFNKALTHSFITQANIVASIHCSDKRLSQYREDPRNLLLEVTTLNRDMLPDALVAITRNLSTINNLTEKQQRVVKDLLIRYSREARLLQVQKLTSNAIHYVAEKNIQRIDDNHWQVNGKHGTHEVVRNEDVFECDCDLFNGRKQYVNQGGVCSHIQSVMIFGI